jgi:hypothetical protein
MDLCHNEIIIFCLRTATKILGPEWLVGQRRVAKAISKSLYLYCLLEQLPVPVSVNLSLFQKKCQLISEP